MCSFWVMERTAISSEHKVGAPDRILPLHVLVFGGHPAMRIAFAIFAVSRDAAAYPRLGCRVQPNAKREVRVEGQPRRTHSLEDQDFRDVGKDDHVSWSPPFPVVLAEARWRSGGQWLQHLLKQARPPIGWIVPTGEVVGMNDRNARECSCHRRRKSRLSGGTAPVNRDHPRLHWRGRFRRDGPFRNLLDRKPGSGRHDLSAP